MWDDSNKKSKLIVENECPYCKELLIMNKRTFANHVRWCKSNPDYQKIRNSTIEKCIKSTNDFYDDKLGQLKCFTVTCFKCGKEFEVYEREKAFPSKERYYCSRSCVNSHVRSEESKKKTSESVKKYLRENGKIVRDDLFQNDRKCLCCGELFFSKIIERKYCSKECATVHRNRIYFQNAFNVAKDDEIEKLKLIRDIYKKQCNFKFSLNDFPEEFNFHLIEEHGWYKAKNHGDNLTGVSRDHMFSKNMGFEQRIDPYIISHPANCRLLIHSDNISKLDKCSITLEELNKRISEWEKKYGKYENKIDYTFIQDYLNNE